MSFVGMLYIYMPHFAVQPLVYPYTIDACRYCGGFIYISAWGFGVARFDRMGNFQEPQGVKRATVQGFTLEPKYRRYYSDNQIYNDGNLMN